LTNKGEECKEPATTIRETREGPCYALLTVKIDANGKSKEYGKHERVPILWLVRCARFASTRKFFPDLAAPVGPVQNIFPLTLPVNYFTSLCPLRPAIWAGSRAVSPVS
jgi:hypothetical protein